MPRRSDIRQLLIEEAVVGWGAGGGGGARREEPEDHRQEPYMTTLPAALAGVRGIAALRSGGGVVKPLQEYHRTLKQ